MGANWQLLAVIHVLVGYEADLLGLLASVVRDKETVNGLLIAGFFFYTIVALIVSLQKFADLKGPEKVINIILVILLILAGQNRSMQSSSSQQCRQYIFRGGDGGVEKSEAPRNGLGLWDGLGGCTLPV